MTIVRISGYKDHVKADADSKLITEYSVTSACVHDSQEFIALLDENDRTIYAIMVPEIQTTVEKKSVNMV